MLITCSTDAAENDLAEYGVISCTRAAFRPSVTPGHEPALSRLPTDLSPLSPTPLPVAYTASWVVDAALRLYKVISGFQALRHARARARIKQAPYRSQSELAVHCHQRPSSVAYTASWVVDAALRLYKVWFLYIARPQQGDLKLSGTPSGQGAVVGARARTEGSLQISERIRYPLCHRRPSKALSTNPPQSH
ncbi:hypothetical protein PoB_004558900 [Plakobranchus ocellatus]|uniref:Uncharacterized protein n=1 Tax=Plakobranchus ocellatus TaxID=259542 RepID=A0AAV4BG74_9GAST|nr:hypothetical protein PoB_004558900 [Plakobranchus ocellatus]